MSSGTAKLLGLAALALMALAAVTLLWQRADPIAATESANSITSPDTVDDVGTFTSLALDAAGNPVVSYFDSTNLDLKLLHCGDPSCSSGNTINAPDTMGFVGESTSLALDASGNPVVSYYDWSNREVKLLHCGDPTCSAGNSTTALGAVGSLGTSTSLALDGNGFPVVSYFDVTAFDLKVVHCGNANCTSANSITAPDPAGGVGANSSLALDASGNPVVSYHDFTNRDLKLLHCGDPTCSSGNTITSPDTAGDVGWGTSLALDASGNPVVSYIDYTNFDVKVLHCGDPACSSGNSITAPDTEGEFVPGTSLALDANGHPVVSYHDGFSALKVLHCGDPTCSSGNTISTPDTPGFYSSLALDASGNPVVSYGGGFGDLKLLHCGDPSCKAPPPTPTATPAPPADTPAPPPPVGGIAVDPDLGAIALETPEPSKDNSGLLGGIAAATGVLALGGAAWYARRRVRR